MRTAKIIFIHYRNACSCPCSTVVQKYKTRCRAVAGYIKCYKLTLIYTLWKLLWYWFV